MPNPAETCLRMSPPVRSSGSASSFLPETFDYSLRRILRRRDTGIPRPAVSPDARHEGVGPASQEREGSYDPGRRDDEFPPRPPGDRERDPQRNPSRDYAGA